MYQICQKCNGPSSAGSAFCNQCGANLTSQKKASTKRWIVIGGIVAAMGGILWLNALILSRSSVPKTTKPSSVAVVSPTPTPTPVPFTDGEHLAEAKKMIDASKYSEAYAHLNAIQPSAKEYARAEKLHESLRKHEADLVNREADRQQKALITSREAFANYAEEHFLKSGHDFHVTVNGPNKTTITFKYVLMSRPMVYKINNETSFMTRLRSEGFRKLIMTDGYNETWTVNL